MVSSEPISSLVAKTDFLRVPEVAHLCAGGETAILRSHHDAVQRFFEGKSDGMAGRLEQSMGLLERVRERAATLFGVSASDIAFLSSSTDGINQLTNGLDWQPGDNVVVEDIEFPSGIFPWTRFEQRGVELRVVRQWGADASIERLADAVDGRTRVVATSQVSYLTGRRYDLDELAAIAHESGALLSIDATHAAGVLPVAAHHADIVVSSCYKFLLGVHGAAVFYCNPERLSHLQPQQLGWNSTASQPGVQDPTGFTLRDDAKRFEAANPPFLALAVLDNALAYLQEIGIERMEQHVLALGDLLWDELDRRGIRPISPRDARRRGPNVAFLWPDPALLTAQLAERGVLVWGDSGRVRVSFHAYNDQADIERFLAALDEVMGSHPTA
ncbi:MAG TPA: aminotransferase class V-fold PLP-dependent enzyme [Vicinamibacterales bacterium]|nr:aminotransferase class V-fold PLP-dependent enzyme [Vicinamibacterales bacterium]